MIVRMSAVAAQMPVAAAGKARASCSTYSFQWRGTSIVLCAVT